MANEAQKPVLVIALAAIIVVALGYIGYSVLAHMQQPSADSQPKTAPVPDIPEPPHVIVAHWDTDTSNDVNAMEEYRRAAGEALQQGKYDELERIASEDRSKKLRFSGGTWKLLELYRGLTRPVAGDQTKDADWQAMLQRLEAWTKQKPNSITARLALADAYSNYGYFARGEDDIYHVSEDQYKVFQERTQKARDILEDAHRLPADCPHWYYAMLRVALQQEWDAKEEEAVFEKAIAYEPTYYTYYRERARFLQPKWNGEPGDFARFADGIADRIGGDEGDRVYFEIAATCQCATDPEFKMVKWTRVKRGYEKLQSKYGASLVKMNQMAWLASQNADPMFAAQLFAQIGDNYSAATWRAKKYFVGARDWANKAVNPGGAYPEAARANLKSESGRAFNEKVNAEFNRKYAKELNGCRAAMADQLRSFDIYTRLSNDGTLGVLSPNLKNDFVSCVTAKVQGASLAPPPQADYWVRLSVPDHE